MKKILEGFVISSAILVLLGTLIIFYALGYMNYGHPPGSGIVFIIVLMIVSPIAFIASIVGFCVKRPLALNEPLVYVALGINVFLIFFDICVLVFKVILGAPL